MMSPVTRPVAPCVTHVSARASSTPFWKGIGGLLSLSSPLSAWLIHNYRDEERSGEWWVLRRAVISSYPASSVFHGAPSMVGACSMTPN